LSARLCALLGNTSSQELIPFGHPPGHLKGRETDRSIFNEAASCPRLRAPGVPA
jgi:hypothetical protein